MLKVILSFLLITISLNAQWNWISPAESSNRWYCYDIYEDTHIWLAGLHGAISRTTDGGETWQFLDFEQNTSINCIKFFDENNGMLAKSKNIDNVITKYVYKTSDGGNSWEKLDVTPENFVVKIIKTSDGTLFIITEFEVLMSADDGQTWISETLTSANNQQLSDIEELKNGEIWISSQNGSIFEKGDNNFEWKVIHSGGITLDNIFPIDKQTIYIASPRSKLLKTFDGGDTWVTEGQELLTGLTLDFIDKDNGYAFGSTLIAKTTNGGLVWEMDTQIPQNTFSAPKIKISANKVYYLSNNTIPLKMTSDYGISWTPLSNIIPEGGFELVFKNKQIGFSGSYGKLMKTTDSGFSWHEVLNDEFKSMSNVVILPDNTIYCYASYRTLYKSYDNGDTWNSITAPGGYSMKFLNSEVGYLTENDLYLNKTTDSGLSWTKTKVKDGLSHLFDCDFVSENEGWLVGGRTNTPGVILHTTNGTNYNIQYSNDNQELTKVQFVSSSTGWVLGSENYDESIVLKTEDGGVSWEEVFRFSRIYDFHLFDKDHAVLICKYGSYFETFDGGNTWSQSVLPMSDPQKIFALDAEHIWIADINGGIISTISEPITVSVEENTPIDKEYTFSLGNNYPNPFNPTTTITFTLPESKKVSLKVFNMLGKEVATLIDATVSAGEHNVKFNGANLSSGIYFYQLITPENSITKKMILVK